MVRADEMSVDSRVVSREAKEKEARTTTSVYVWWSVKCSGVGSDRACVHVVPQCRTRRKKPGMRADRREKERKRKRERKDETDIEL
jgi:hypothetical protein